MLGRLQRLFQDARHYPRFRDKLLSFYNLLLVSRKRRRFPLPGRRSQPPKTILDLGSNVGFSIRYWLEPFPNARVVGVEVHDGFTPASLLALLVGKGVHVRAYPGGKREVCLFEFCRSCS